MTQYDFHTIERRWQKVWRAEKIYEPFDFAQGKKPARPPFYNLMMFPYPSAEGLHVGNMYAFVGSDIYGRMKRMQGYDVFEPIGLDGFGIHSENYALKIKAHPMTQAKVSEKRFYGQLEGIGNGFASEERLETYDPEYYRWTQWIFIQMFKKGLAYRKKAPVNWCPSCKTVLADEQVVGGRCERCSHAVVKKELEQWFFRITAYADRLLKNLDEIDWSERVKIAQRNWIGRSEGALLEFKVKNSDLTIDVFTTRPDTLFGATFIVLAPENPLITAFGPMVKNVASVMRYVHEARKKREEERTAAGKKTGVELKGVKAVNPANGEAIPIWVADYVLMSYGTGAIMAVPAHDERDFEFAKKFKLPMKIVVCPHYHAPTCPVLDGAYEGKGHLVGSGKFNGMDSEKAKWGITKFVGGKRQVHYRLRDWLISRQRYWGPPIPMVYCPACAKATAGKENPGWIAVPEKDLPVKLPFVKDFRPKGKGVSPLASVRSFYEVSCPACEGKARRETDVSDTFLDSAWYYIGYLATSQQPLATRNPFSNPLVQKWLPVNMYIGGAEHSVLHLLYSRFLAMAFHDWGLTGFEEPFTKFRAHGLLIREGAKMSKSKGNVVNPDEYIKKYGADVFRTYLMFLAPFEQGGDFRDAGILGIARFLNRVLKVGEAIKKSPGVNPDPALTRIIHQTIKKVTEDIEQLHYNTAVSALMIALNEIEARTPVDFYNQTLARADWESFLKLLAPFAPHLTEELWHQLGHKTSIHRAPWPEYQPKFLEADTFELIVQVNGKFRASITVPRNVQQRDAESVALSDGRVARHVRKVQVRRVVFVPNRLVNFIT